MFLMWGGMRFQIFGPQAENARFRDADELYCQCSVVKCSVNYIKSTCNDVGIPERTKPTIFGMNKQIGSVI